MKTKRMIRVRENWVKRRSEAKVRVDHGESFVGFLTPPGVSPGDSPTLDALTAAAPPLPEIITALAGTAPATYVVSWLDHFFVLKFATERKSAGLPVRTPTRVTQMSSRVRWRLWCT